VFAAEQYEWLKKDLAKVDRSVTPWLVASWHPPWYSSYTAHYREAECMKEAMEELLYSYGTDIVFNGHVRPDPKSCHLSFFAFRFDMMDRFCFFFCENLFPGACL